MIKFGKIKGKGDKFKTVLESKLQNFKEGSDYYTYHEASGLVRRNFYVVCSEKPLKVLQEVDWGNLEGFKKIEVGKKTGKETKLKFIVETLSDKEVPYQTTKPNKSSFIGSIDSSSSQIKEITDQEAKQIEQQRPFFPKSKGNF